MSKHSKAIWWFSLVLILVVSISTAAFAQEVEHLPEPQTNCPIEFEEPTVEYPPEPMTTTCHFDYPPPEPPKSPEPPKTPEPRETPEELPDLIEPPPEPREDLSETRESPEDLPDLPDLSETRKSPEDLSEPDMSEFNVSSSYLNLDMVRDFFFHDTETPLLVLSDEVGTWKFGFAIEKENDFLLYLKTIEKDNEMYFSQNGIRLHRDVYDELLEMYETLSQIN